MTVDLRDPLDLALDWLLRVQQQPEDGQLREQLAQWLAEDEANRVAYRKAERVWTVTGQLGGGPATVVPSTPLAAPVAARPVRTPRRRRRLLQALGAAAACCVVLLTHQDLYLAWQADYQASAGEPRAVELPDGSTVTLNAGAAIAVDFEQSRRHVTLLQGQGYFEVAKDARHPFQVDSGSLQVTVTGTAFNVDRQQGRVNVAHGSVQVAAPDGPTASLTPGHGVRLNAEGHLANSDQPASQVAAWRQGRLIVRDERIADVVAALRPYLDGVVLVRDKQLGEQRVTGVYDLNTPDATLQAVLRAHQGKVVRVGPLLALITRD